VYRTRFLGTLLFFALLVLAGMAGYMGIEKQGWANSLYMTVITVTAVGYNEVFPLSGPGRVLTSFILFGGITGIGLWIAFLTSFVVEEDLAHAFRRRRVQKRISKMKNHVIVCGAGRTGSQVVEELLAAGEEFVVVERDRAKAQQLLELLPDLVLIEGDATVDHFLEEAGIHQARGLIACLSADTDNLFVCLTARDLRKDLEIVARAYEEASVPKLYRAGANHVVSPNASGAIRMASFMIRPSVVSFLDVATRSPDLSLRLEQETVDGSSPLAGKTLLDARIPKATGLIVIALRKKNPEGSEEDYTFLFNPVATTRLDPGDVMIVLGAPEQIETLQKFVNPRG